MVIYSENRAWCTRACKILNFKDKQRTNKYETETVNAVVMFIFTLCCLAKVVKEKNHNFILLLHLFCRVPILLPTATKTA